MCANLCPAGAISMKWSEDGFLVPEVSETLCTHCGVCLAKCPVEMQKSASVGAADCTHVYGGWNTDAVLHEQSSSGGIFSSIAQWVLARGGCVFGVVWEDKLHAVFAMAENEAELSAMRGSKYVQAEPRRVYVAVRAELMKGRYVLFVGTACQVQALKVFLRKNYERLITIDIVCHGMPSRLLFQKYVSEKEALTGKEIERVSFRDKPEGWYKYHVTSHFTDGSSVSTELLRDSYMRLFLCDKGLKTLCYDCPFIQSSRPGDISLGDFWGVEHFQPEWPIHRGISAIIANSEWGNQILLELESEGSIRLYPEKLEHMIPYQGGFKRHTTQPPAERGAFLSGLRHYRLPRMEFVFLDSVVVCGVRMHRDTRDRLYRLWRRIRGYVLVKLGLIK